VKKEHNPQVSSPFLSISRHDQAHSTTRQACLLCAFLGDHICPGKSICQLSLRPSPSHIISTSMNYLRLVGDVSNDPRNNAGIHERQPGISWRPAKVFVPVRIHLYNPPISAKIHNRRIIRIRIRKGNTARLRHRCGVYHSTSAKQGRERELCDCRYISQGLRPICDWHQTYICLGQPL